MYQARRGKQITVKLRIPSELQALIHHACKLTGKSSRQFVVEAAREKAIEALSDRAIFMAQSRRYEAFIARLNEQQRPSERLQKTLFTQAPWEKRADNPIRPQ